MATSPDLIPDLYTCDREPIHIPGSIQPHGMLLVLDEATLRVTHASANAVRWIDGDEHELDAFDPALVPAIRDLRDRDAIEPQPRFVRQIQWEADAAHIHDVTVHRAPAGLIVELEPATDADAARGRGPGSDLLMLGVLGRLETANSVEELCRRAAAEIRRLIGFDRVLVYRFDADSNGTVVAEDRNDILPSYLGLRFPASDIPAQARELYRTNRTRLIADAGYTPVPILARTEHSWDDLYEPPLDLQLAALRSVSPVHVEYMVNMGTWSSFSISILHNDKLWGLFACHHQTPRRVGRHDRATCDFLGRVFSIQLAAQAQRVEYEDRIGGSTAQARLLAAMSDADDFVQGLLSHSGEMLELVGATGAAIVHEGQTHTIGVTPEPENLERIVAWLGRDHREEVFACDTLIGEMPDALDFREQASGILAISISKLHRGYILWFRPEVIRTVAWGGDPTKAIVAEEDGRIHPRRSFEAWLETVRHHARPWRESDIAAASEFRNTIVGIILRRAEERAQLSTELERSNKELEAFSYSVSHDLRAPFRHIVGYSDLLREEEGAKLSSEGMRYLNTIIDAAQNAGSLVDNLLAFSRMGRTTIHPVPIDMNALVREVVREAMMEAGNRSITWKIDPLPPIEGDLMMMRLALGNLASNAVKYTRTCDDARIEIHAETTDDEVIFQVKDNGVGFDMRYVDKLFGVFQRLHRQEEFEGTGIGLANVRRIIGRHGGRTWAEGALNQGASFWFALPRHGDSLREQSARRVES